ncbi:MAG: 30S ribosomal protein S30e [Candidatus Bathyarchaeia archaeon]
MPTHGSLTKAGKVRNQTPKIESQHRKNPTPQKRNLRNYTRRILHSSQSGSRPQSRS